MNGNGMKCQSRYKAVVVGMSRGGINALPIVLGPLPDCYLAPVIVVQHLHPSKHGDYLIEHLNKKCWLNIREARDKEPVTAGQVYVAPADQHLSIREDSSIMLSNGEKVHYSRPAIDVLFESAATAYSSGLVDVLMTGTSPDGALGMKAIKDRGGLVIVQGPESAESPEMPGAAMETCAIDHVLPLRKYQGCL